MTSSSHNERTQENGGEQLRELILRRAVRAAILSVLAIRLAAAPVGMSVASVLAELEHSDWSKLDESGASALFHLKFNKTWASDEPCSAEFYTASLPDDNNGALRLRF